jgi:hypothetical protein
MHSESESLSALFMSDSARYADGSDGFRFENESVPVYLKG